MIALMSMSRSRKRRMADPAIGTAVVGGLFRYSVLCAALLFLIMGQPHLVLRGHTESRQGRGIASSATRTNPQDQLDYVLIPPGTFQMGCSGDDKECEDLTRSRRTQ